jgi:hypothetical protein
MIRSSLMGVTVDKKFLDSNGLRSAEGWLTLSNFYVYSIFELRGDYPLCFLILPTSWFLSFSALALWA